MSSDRSRLRSSDEINHAERGSTVGSATQVGPTQRWSGLWAWIPGPADSWTGLNTAAVERAGAGGQVELRPRFRLLRCARSAASREPPARDCHWCPGRRGAHCSTSGAPRPAPHLAARTDVGELLVSCSSEANSWKSPQFRVSRVSRASESTESDRPASHSAGSNRIAADRPIAWSAIGRLPVRIRRGIDHPLTSSHPLCGEDGARSRRIPSRIDRRLGDHRLATCS